MVPPPSVVIHCWPSSEPVYVVIWPRSQKGLSQRLLTATGTLRAESRGGRGERKEALETKGDVKGEKLRDVEKQKAR